MADPHEVLGLDRGAGDEEVRRRYLELVRQFPPDRDPDRFVAVRAAYDQLRDPIARMQSQLFNVENRDSMDAILADARQQLRRFRIPTETLLSLAEKR
jgi:curved DNA-binding protein CbpA